MVDEGGGSGGNGAGVAISGNITRCRFATLQGRDNWIEQPDSL